MTLPNYWDELQPYLPATFTQEETHPVVGVSYYEAEAYCNWLSAVSGMNFHLPTEAQWEKAARWDSVAATGYIYPWGDDWNYNWYNNYDDIVTTDNQTSVVGSYPAGASSYGCLDMAGNVWEWCSSGYKSYTSSYDPLREPFEFDFSEFYKIARGSAWDSGTTSDSRTFYRYAFRPENRRNVIGFRCAWDSA